MLDARYHLRYVTKFFKRKYEMVSFPKCGRTWVRFMLGNILNDYFRLSLSCDDMFELEKKVHYRRLKIPFIAVHHDENAYKKHLDEIVFDHERYQGKRIVFMVRDPRDVVVSQYHQLSKRQHLINCDLSTFIRSKQGGLPCIVKFYNEWFAGIGCAREYLILRYEDFKADTFGELKKLLFFLRLEYIPDEFIRRAVLAADFARMQKLEKNGAFMTSRMRPLDTSDVQTFKTRKGKVGGYVDECSPEDIAFLQTHIRSFLHPDTGYV